MIAMQYSITLPADYDMAIIDRRIAEKGHLMDGFPGLLFKAYLSARKTGQPPASENLYAPFYLWESTQGMNAFLCGAGFAGLSQSFGWPSVKTWSVWHAELSPAISTARFATRELVPILPHARLDEVALREARHAAESVDGRTVLAAVAGFEPANWSLVRFRLWAEHAGETQDMQGQRYAVGHVSTAQ